ncbi:MAG: iron-containing alcohol dehydrogenase [Aggregatilineales bacterium]
MNVWPLPRITFHELSTVQESRLTALITTPTAWATIKQSIELPIVIRAEPARSEREFLEALAADLPASIGVIYAIGADTILDAAKVVASKSKKPLVLIPTAFSSDALVSWTAAVRDQGIWTDLVTGPADEVVIDWQIITEALPGERGAGIADVLAITTALLDWRSATQKNKTTPDTRLSAWGVSVAAALAQQAMKIAPAIGQGSPEALRTLLDLMCMMVQLDSQLGHRRASHGAEHIFADIVKADPSISHPEKVAAGILYAAALNGLDVSSLRSALEAAGIQLDVLTGPNVRAAANGLADYVQQNNLPYGTASDQTDSATIAAALTKSTLMPAPAGPKVS